MKARELAEKLMENPDAEVEIWDQYDYMFGAWTVVEPHEVQSDGETTRLTTGGHDFNEPNQNY